MRASIAASMPASPSDELDTFPPDTPATPPADAAPPDKGDQAHLYFNAKTGEVNGFNAAPDPGLWYRLVGGEDTALDALDEGEIPLMVSDADLALSPTMRHQRLGQLQQEQYERPFAPLRNAIERMRRGEPPRGVENPLDPTLDPRYESESLANPLRPIAPQNPGQGASIAPGADAMASAGVPRGLLPVSAAWKMLAQGPVRLQGGTGVTGDPGAAVRNMEWFRSRGIADTDVPNAGGQRPLLGGSTVDAPFEMDPGLEVDAPMGRPVPAPYPPKPDAGPDVRLTQQRLIPLAQAWPMLVSERRATGPAA